MDILAQKLLSAIDQHLLFAVVLIGNSGSGKTTFANELAKCLRIEIISPDIIRADLGNVLDQTLNQMAWQVIGQMLFEKSQAGESIIFDATNAKLEDRRKLLSDLHEKGFYSLGIWMDTPLEICRQNNMSRQVSRPEHALIHMDRSLSKHPPLRWEGFDCLYRVQNHQASEIH